MMARQFFVARMQARFWAVIRECSAQTRIPLRCIQATSYSIVVAIR